MASGLCLVITLPTMTRSGMKDRFSGLYPLKMGMERDSRKLLIGGYTFSYDTVTEYPLCFRMPAREAIPVPHMPIRWIRFGSGGIVLRAGVNRGRSAVLIISVFMIKNF